MLGFDALEQIVMAMIISYAYSELYHLGVVKTL